MSQRTLCALVIDDHPIMAGAVATALNAMRLFERVDAKASLADAVQFLRANPACHLVVVDLHLGDADGRESLTWLREEFPDVPALVFSGDESFENIAMAFECGARGYVPKSSPTGVLGHAVQLVLSGGSYVPAQAVNVLGKWQPPPGGDVALGVRSLRLSGRQEQVFRLLLQGMPNKVIASRLSMAEGTVKAHLNTVFRVLGVRTRVEAILRARELGLT